MRPKKNEVQDFHVFNTVISTHARLEMDVFLLKCSVSVENNNSCNLCLVNAASFFISGKIRRQSMLF